MYQVEQLIVVFDSYKCTNGNVLNFTRVLWPTAGNGPQSVFRTHFESGNVFIKKAGQPKEKNVT